MGFAYIIEDCSSVKKNKPDIERQVPHVASQIMKVKMRSHRNH